MVVLYFKMFTKKYIRGGVLEYVVSAVGGVVGV